MLDENLLLVNYVHHLPKYDLPLVNCGVPESPINGTVDMPDHTREGAMVDYGCDDGFRPASDFTSICESTAMWALQPQDHNCTFITGKKNG